MSPDTRPRARLTSIADLAAEGRRESLRCAGELFLEAAEALRDAADAGGPDAAHLRDLAASADALGHDAHRRARAPLAALPSLERN